MKKVILVLLLIAGSNLQAQKKWTLRECVEYALENNISIKQSELDLESVEAEKLAALGNFLPSLNSNISLNENTGLNFNPTTNRAETTTFLSSTGSVSAAYTLFDGLRNIRTAQRAEINELASQYRLSKMRDDISLFVAQGYLQAVSYTHLTLPTICSV